MEEGLITAPEITPGGAWFNSRPLTLSKLRGQVVLVDFMSYTCINCIRTFPYLNRWYETYKDKGLEIIGVHSPEFEFEKDKDNLKSALALYKIKFPVVQDNNYDTWNAYANHYWPAKYFVDKNGKIRWTHFGEGSYDKSEIVIQELLKEVGVNVKDIPINNPPYTVEASTPELYLGYWRMVYFASKEDISPEKTALYTVPEKLPLHSFAFGGKWMVAEQYSSPQNGSALMLHFEAKKVFLVARTKGEPGQFKVMIDNTVIRESEKGSDVDEGIVPVIENRLYEVVSLPKRGEHVLNLEFLDNNLELYAFTFG